MTPEPQVGIEPTTARGQNNAQNPQLPARHSLTRFVRGGNPPRIARIAARNRNGTATAFRDLLPRLADALTRDRSPWPTDGAA